MGWMFQFVFGTYLGLTWELLGSYLEVTWELFGKDNAHIAVIIIRGHPEDIPKEYYMKNMYWILTSKNYRIKQLIIPSIEIENNTKEKRHSAYLRQKQK